MQTKCYHDINYVDTGIEKHPCRYAITCTTLNKTMQIPYSEATSYISSYTKIQ